MWVDRGFCIVLGIGRVSSTGMVPIRRIQVAELIVLVVPDCLQRDSATGLSLTGGQILLGRRRGS